jgi:hypothetical protein
MIWLIIKNYIQPNIVKRKRFGWICKFYRQPNLFSNEEAGRRITAHGEVSKKTRSIVDPALVCGERPDFYLPPEMGLPITPVLQYAITL